METARFLADKPALVRVERAMLTSSDRAADIDVHAEATLTSSNGVAFHLVTSYREPTESMWFEVHGDRGTLRAVFAPGAFGQALVLTLKGDAPKYLEVPHQAETMRVDRYADSLGYSVQLRHFFAAFRVGEAPEESITDGTHVLEALNAIYLAAGRGRPVDLKDVPRDATPAELWKGTSERS